MNKARPEHYLYSISELSKMLGFERRVIETRLYVNRVVSLSEDRGVKLFVLRDAVEAVYRTQFTQQGATCPNKSTN